MELCVIILSLRVHAITHNLNSISRIFLEHVFSKKSNYETQK